MAATLPVVATAVVQPEIAAFLGGGLIMYLATRGPDLQPESLVVPGVRVEDGGCRLTVFVPEIFAPVTLANLRDNGRAALTVVRVTDDRSIQIKGTYLGHRPGDADDRRLVEAQLERRTHELARVGLPRSVSARLVGWPCVAVQLKVGELFVQTPGPGAGRPLGGTQDLR